MQPYKDMIHTITADNGKEFARQYIPKGTDFEDLTDEYIAICQKCG